MGRVQAGHSHQGWYAVLCFFVSFVLWSWVLKALGVMLPTLQEQFVAQTWLVGWMIAIINAVSCVTGLLATPLEAMFGTRTVVTISGFMLGVSMIIASFSTSIVMFTSILALAAGPALSVVPILTRALIGRSFPTNYGIAAGIGGSGAPIGLITAGPFAQLLLDTYGWRGALLILGGFALHLGVCGAILRSSSTDETETNSSYQPLSTDANEEPRVGSSSAEEKGNLKQSSYNTFKDPLKSMVKHIGISVCFQVSFWFTAVILILGRFVDDHWLIYYVSQAEAKGFSPYEAVTFTTAGGVGNVVSRIVFGFIVDRNLLNLRPALVLMIVLSSSALLIAPWLNTYWLMMAGSFVFCAGNGAIALLNDLYTRELLGTDLLVCAFAWMETLTAILGFSLGFYPGWMYDQSGSFDWAFFILGCISALSLVGLLMEWVLSRCKYQQTA
ncbi:monocarboxylate transporter 12-like isoform X1 [Patiria miniata]|uniref:Major facilitator superfamily (MFS) profile domain-containing protein n=1 Tax=Patiria miniata TaxID=46514 RepID=A0A913ZT65_PATMI|nr:monocarboxylate transporter 12-like isoform X1 [Patiria miniata]